MGQWMIVGKNGTRTVTRAAAGRWLAKHGMSLGDIEADAEDEFQATVIRAAAHRGPVVGSCGDRDFTLTKSRAAQFTAEDVRALREGRRLPRRRGSRGAS